MPTRGTLQACEQRSHEQTFLRLPHVFVCLGLAEPILEEAQEFAALNLIARLSDKVRGHVLQNDRMQREAARLLPTFDERTPTEPIHGFEHLTHWERFSHQGTQLLQAHWLTHNCEPQEQ